MISTKLVSNSDELVVLCKVNTDEEVTALSTVYKMKCALYDIPRNKPFIYREYKSGEYKFLMGEIVDVNDYTNRLVNEVREKASIINKIRGIDTTDNA